jgi:hypothetical protein
LKQKTAVDKRANMVDMICAMNFGLRVGCLVMDDADGEMRYRTNFYAGYLTSEEFKATFRRHHSRAAATFFRYLPAIIEVQTTNVAGRDAVRKIEIPNWTAPPPSYRTIVPVKKPAAIPSATPGGLPPITTAPPVSGSSAGAAVSIPLSATPPPQLLAQTLAPTAHGGGLNGNAANLSNSLGGASKGAMAPTAVAPVLPSSTPIPNGHLTTPMPAHPQYPAPGYHPGYPGGYPQAHQPYGISFAIFRSKSMFLSSSLLLCLYSCSTTWLSSCGLSAPTIWSTTSIPTSITTWRSWIWFATTTITTWWCRCIYTWYGNNTCTTYCTCSCWRW